MLAKASVQRTVAMTSIQTIGGLGRFLPAGLVIGEFVGQVARIVFLLFVAGSSFAKMLGKVRRVEMVALAKRYSNFPKYVAGADFLNFFSLMMPVFFLSIFYGSTDTGYYFLPHKILSVPMIMLGASVSQVFFREAVKIKDDSRELGNLTFGIVKKLLWVGILPFSVIFIFGDFIFSFVFGGEWTISGEYASSLSMWLFMVFITSPVSSIFNVLERQKESFLFNLVLFFIRLLSLGIGYGVWNNPLVAVSLFAGFSFIYWIVLSSYIFRLVKLDVKDCLLYIIKFVSCAVVPLYLLRLFL